MRRVRAAQRPGPRTQKPAYWPGPWLQGTLAALGGTSAIGAFLYAVGWLTGQAQGRLLGVPPGVFDRTTCLFNACRLLPDYAVAWVYCPVTHLAGDPSVLLALAGISVAAWTLLWLLKQVSPRSFQWPRGWSIVEVTLGLLSVGAMFLLIVATADVLTRTSELLCQSPRERLAGLERALSAPAAPIFWPPSAVELLGEPEDGARQLDLKCLISGAVAWAFLAQALWSWSLWRRLGLQRRASPQRSRARGLRRSPAVPAAPVLWRPLGLLVSPVVRAALALWRALGLLLCAALVLWRALGPLLSPVVRAALVLMLGFTGLAALDVNGIVMASYGFPVLEDRGSPTHLLYLGHDGRFFYLYDCQDGELTVRKALDEGPDSGSQGWTCGKRRNVVQVAYDTARAALRSPFAGSTGSAVAAQGIREPES